MTNRKSLLFITDVFPFPLSQGNHIRIYNLLAACGRACDVTFIGPFPRDYHHREHIEKHCVKAVYLGLESLSYMERIERFFDSVRVAPGIPWPSKIFEYEKYWGPLRSVRPESYDLIWAERLNISTLCTKYREKTILDLDDIEHIKTARLLKLPSTLKDRAKILYRYLYYRKIELGNSRHFLASVVCSEKDKKYLSNHGSENVFVVPNAPNIQDATSRSINSKRDLDASPALVFVGPPKSAPNADAIEFIADSILPSLRTKVPGATVDVIGSGVTPQLVQKYDSRITFRGFVEDLGEALAEYDMLLAPLRFGSGTKLKVLDAMSCGIPVLTTEVGAEGLSLTHGENVWLAETATEFAEGVLRIKEDKELANRLAINAKAHVQDLFSWNAIQNQLVHWLKNLQL